MTLKIQDFDSSETISPGHRNSFLRDYAYRLQKSGSPYDEVLDLTMTQNTAFCLPPLSSHEVSRIVDGLFTKSDNTKEITMKEKYVEIRKDLLALQEKIAVANSELNGQEDASPRQKQLAERAAQQMNDAELNLMKLARIIGKES